MTDKELLTTALILADEALAILGARIRPADPRAAHCLAAVRDLLDHAACLQRVGHHVGCDCPRDLARFDLNNAIFHLREIVPSPAERAGAAAISQLAGVGYHKPQPVAFEPQMCYTTKGP